MRFATTGQLARLHFGGSRSAASKRLRRLFDAGLLRAWVPRLDGENVYSLTSRSARFIDDQKSGPCSPAPRGVDGNLEHLLAVGSVRVAIAMTLDDGAELRSWRSYWELEPQFKEPVIPDALFEVHSRNGHQVFAIEVDRTTPSPQAFVRRILNYEAMGGRGYGVSGFALLVVGSKESWLERYRERVAQHPLRLPIWFAAYPEVEAKGAQAAWRSLKGEIVPSLRALLAVRNGGGEKRPDAVYG